MNYTQKYTWACSWFFRAWETIVKPRLSCCHGPSLLRVSLNWILSPRLNSVFYSLKSFLTVQTQGFLTQLISNCVCNIFGWLILGCQYGSLSPLYSSLPIFSILWPLGSEVVSMGIPWGVILMSFMLLWTIFDLSIQYLYFTYMPVFIILFLEC